LVDFIYDLWPPPRLLRARGRLVVKSALGVPAPGALAF
jgi:hypothetical protein